MAIISSFEELYNCIAYVRKDFGRRQGLDRMMRTTILFTVVISSSTVGLLLISSQSTWSFIYAASPESSEREQIGLASNHDVMATIKPGVALYSVQSR